MHRVSVRVSQCLQSNYQTNAPSLPEPTNKNKRRANLTSPSRSEPKTRAEKPETNESSAACAFGVYRLRFFFVCFLLSRGRAICRSSLFFFSFFSLPKKRSEASARIRAPPFFLGGGVARWRRVGRSRSRDAHWLKVTSLDSGNE